jgi:hypothetical protein
MPGLCIRENSEATQGECRRHAPQAIVFNVDGSLKFESRFPQTAAEDWCGGFLGQVRFKIKMITQKPPPIF